MSEAIAVLGAGRMGTAIVQRLLERSFAVTVWNRTRARTQLLTTRGARAVETVHDAVAAADVVITILSDYAATDKLLQPEDTASALRGKVLVQLASGSPAQARAMETWAQGAGVAYLDGAIMVPPDLIGKSECLILYSGDPSTFGQHESLLRELAGNSVFAGSAVGNAAALDSALLMQYWGALFGAVYGTAVTQAEHIPLATYQQHVQALLPIIDHSVLDLISRVSRTDLATTPATIETHHGGLQHVLDICRERGLDSAVPEAFARLTALAIDRGHAQHDFAALAPLIVKAPS